MRRTDAQRLAPIRKLRRQEAKGHIPGRKDHSRGFDRASVREFEAKLSRKTTCPCDIACAVSCQRTGIRPPTVSTTIGSSVACASAVFRGPSV
jgi:hypothetical protein